MDAESLVLVAQIFTTALSGAEERLRQELTVRFQEAERHTDERFNQAVLLIGEKFEEAERHSGVLHEDALHRTDLIVEGHQTLDHKIDALEARMENAFVETRSLIQLSYR